ncbi:MAG: hypothetical protein ACFHVJ_08560 [Aestuariibacter sp.]
MNPLLVSNSTTPVDTRNIAKTQGISPASAQSRPFVYAVGSIVPDFPSLCVEKEFLQSLPAQAAQQLHANTTSSKALSMASLTPYFYEVLSTESNFHLAREMQWNFINADNNQLFRIIPSSNARLKELINATKINPDKKQVDRQVLVGRKKSSAHVLMTRLSSVSEAKLVATVCAKNSAIDQTKLLPIIEFILSLQANDGSSVKSRAINYALYFNPEIYIKSYELLYGTASNGANPSGYQLLGIKTRQQEYNGGHQVDIVFDYAGINSGAPQSWYCSVDVSGEFPYLLKTFARFLPNE